MANVQQVKRIIEDLKNPRAYFRSKAIENLMAITDASLIPEMSRLFSKEPDFVKIQFCRFLGRIRGELAVPPLVILLLDKSEKIAQEAANALDRIDNDRKTEAMMLLLKRGNHFSKVYAIKALGQGRKIKAVPVLIKLLPSGGPDIKEAAVEALRLIGDPSAIGPLLKLLDEKNERVIYNLLFALGEMGEQKAAPDIMKFLSHHDQYIRKAAVWALGKLGYRKAIPKLIQILRYDESEIVREEAAKRLGQIGRAEVVKPLLYSKVFDKAHNVMVYSDWALSDMSAENKVGTLLKLTDEKDETLRGQAFLEIAKISNIKFLKFLRIALSEDKSEYTRTCIAEGLGFMNIPEVKNILKNLLKDTTPVRRKAADSLLRVATSEDSELAANMVQGALCDDSYIREIGIKIIEKIYRDSFVPEDIMELLKGLVAGQDEAIKKAAEEAISKLNVK